MPFDLTIATENVQLHGYHRPVLSFGLVRKETA